ncbi:ABC transporter ATP-binding protein [Rhizobium rhizogenes]|uniref:ABC transporter ATP-binding protein n=1 Tax=Rhizobium rhizogenes TaxID=359 RepID=UPI00080F8EB4|nr:ABC transporter ATP-binding protein [Rhizobium rhizogenes]MDJ1634396.1 ABC transporter ATP-binding protein [Rhizobium rhizogenes]NTI44163.1 ABC transporter ATP-binding protein [Rhizobium rhizogenes]OCJ18597.1 ABC transporter ATP-binding protein [Agrobacterium sp. B131/95]
MASVSLESVSKSFGTHSVIQDVNLQINDGEFVVFVGPSGCGKSTLLRIVAGLISASKGVVSIGGDDVTDVPASKRGVAFVFQSYALYPHMSVARNIGFALETLGMGRDAVRQKVASVARMLKVDHLLERRPRELSGGQRQRVAIGRALVRQPEIFLFDEPLSNLDSDLRMEMRMEIAKLHDDLKTTMIYVTHDQSEAMTLADRIVVLNHGRIEQIGTPQELYHAPDNRFVAGFIGSPRMNFLPVAMRQAAGADRIEGPGGLSIGAVVQASAEPVAAIGIRPESLRLVDALEGRIVGTLERVEDLGHEHFGYCRITDDVIWVIRLAMAPAQHLIGKLVGLDFADTAMFVFDADGKRLTLDSPEATDQ